MKKRPKTEMVENQVYWGKYCIYIYIYIYIYHDNLIADSLRHGIEYKLPNSNAEFLEHSKTIRKLLDGETK